MTDANDPDAALPADEAPPVVPPGWYPTPSGTQRYWDGAKWTSLPSPSDDAAVPSAVVGATVVKRSRAPLIIAAAIAIVILAVIAGLLLKNSADSSAAAAKLASQQKIAAQVKHDAAVAKAQKDAAERKTRADAIPGIESSVKTMAKKDARDGAIDGPILSVTCSPVNGGSTDDLAQLTTVFECFAADKNNKDGTQSGYYFNATMNWSTGSYTYGLGKPNG
jgi:hypothetical protein